MTTRFYLLEDLGRVVKIEGGNSQVWVDGRWANSPSAWDAVKGIASGPDAREITAAEAARLVREGRAGGERFGWSEEDLASNGVKFE